MPLSKLRGKVRLRLYNFLKTRLPINTKYRPKGIVQLESIKNSRGVSYYEINPAYTSKLSLPSKFFEECSAYNKPTLLANFPGDFVVSLTNGRIYKIDLGNIAVMSGDNFLIDGLSFQWDMEDGDGLAPAARNAIFTRKMFDRPSKYAGTVFSLLSGGGAADYYYHWVIDSIPKLHLLRQSGLFDQIDYFLVPNYALPFQKQYLKHFGIDESKIINVKKTRHIEADRLVVASYVRVQAHLPNWVPEFLRRSFVTEAPKTTGKLIYISRKDSPLSRKVVNEEQVIELLKPMGFEVYVLSGLDIWQQAQLFNSAALIVSSHGGGLTNLVFCNPGTKVLEFFPENYVNHLFYDIAIKSGLKYDHLVCKADEQTLDTLYKATTNVVADLPSLEAKVKALLAL
jgi:hypothetical protein